MVILFVLRLFSRIFIKIDSFCNIPFRFCAIFYESTHASVNFRIVMHVSIFNCGHFSLWAFFPVGIFPCVHFSLWAFFLWAFLVGIFPMSFFLVGIFPVTEIFGFSKPSQLSNITTDARFTMIIIYVIRLINTFLIKFHFNKKYCLAIPTFNPKKISSNYARFGYIKSGVVTVEFD